MVAADKTDAAGIGEAATLSLVGDKFDGAEKADRADFSDQRVILEFRKHLAESRPGELLGPRDELLLLDNLEIFQGDRARHGMAGERVAVMEVVGVRHQRIGNLIADDNA